MLLSHSSGAWLAHKEALASYDDSSHRVHALLMYILLWALGPLGPITLLVQHTYTCTALYLYRTLMPPI